MKILVHYLKTSKHFNTVRITFGSLFLAAMTSTFCAGAAAPPAPVPHITPRAAAARPALAPRVAPKNPAVRQPPAKRVAPTSKPTPAPVHPSPPRTSGIPQQPQRPAVQNPMRSGVTPAKPQMQVSPPKILTATPAPSHAPNSTAPSTPAPTLTAPPTRHYHPWHHVFGRLRRFEEGIVDAEFYFPNDYERHYRWIKISPTIARNVITGRTIVLVGGTSVIFVPSGPGFTASIFPPAASATSNTLRVRNPNKYSASVELKSGDEKRNLNVAANDAGSIELPDGTYEVFFQFSDRPSKRFQGDDVSLHGNVAEILLESVADGNYGMREVN